jgi:hypothetical protein
LSSRGLADRVLSYAHRMELPEPRRESDGVSQVQECYRFWEQVWPECGYWWWMM